MTILQLNVELACERNDRGIEFLNLLFRRQLGEAFVERYRGIDQPVELLDVRFKCSQRGLTATSSVSSTRSQISTKSSFVRLMPQIMRQTPYWACCGLFLDKPATLVCP